MSDSLDRFHPLVRSWFLEEVGRPTDIQRLAWPRIADDRHVLVSAPTGSGKTLTAFLWALDRLFSGAWPGERVRVLYVSPLRALNTDVRRNLEGPLEALRRRFAAAGEAAPGIRVATRSGDTPTNERRKMLRQPPEILVTTPESLNILLTSKSGRQLLGDLRAVVLDEIHAVAGSKRGVHLLTAIERLVRLSGEFQRIALSATVRPMETVAAMVGGLEMLGEPAPDGVAAMRPRDVEILRAPSDKAYEVAVRFPAEIDPESERDDDSMWEILTRDVRRVVDRNRSTLLFANSRRTTERVTRMLNAGGGAGPDVAYSHHGSLSREVRQEVERRLKDGELKAIVATNSLELGIDIGVLDEVLLVQTPPTIASAVQRIGRAGHGVGETSRGTFYPTHGGDLMEAAVVARAVLDQEIEPLRPVEGPLDVLAQVVLSMLAAESWSLDALYAQIRTAWAYRELDRRSFDLVIDMLAGRYADSRIRELRPRLQIDRVRRRVSARPGVERLIYMAGGTIADRGYFALRHKDSMAKIGELDEEFVWERSVGDTFTLGAQSWQIHRITHNDVLVVPGRGGGALAPFWRADARDRGPFLCQRVAAFLEQVEAWLDEQARSGSTVRDRAAGSDGAQRSLLHERLTERHRLEPRAVQELVTFLEEQRTRTGGKLPRRDRLLAERTGGLIQQTGTRLVILHTFWGGTVHRPLAMVLRAAWEERHGEPLEIYHDDLCLLLRLPDDLPVAEVFDLVAPEQVEQLLRRELEGTGFFGARFREAAQASLLLPRAGFRQRTPLWLHRQRAKKLLDSVSSYGDFPIVVEAWRACLRDAFELGVLKDRLEAVRSGALPIEEVRSTSPSPLAAGLVWQFTNNFMYEDDTPESATASRLRHDVLQELVYAGHLRPRLPPALVERFRRKAQRLDAGYAPPPGEELALWMTERLLQTPAEWHELVTASARDHQVSAEDAAASVADAAARVRWPDGTIALAALDAVPRLEAVTDDSAFELEAIDGGALSPAALARLNAARQAGERSGAVPETSELSPPARRLAEFLRFHGPLDVAALGPPWTEREVSDLLTELIERRIVVRDRLTQGTDREQVCDAENLEILLRWLRVEARPQLAARPAAELPLFLACHQGLAATDEGTDALRERLEQLFGWPAPAGRWEAELLPARLDPYYPAWLDAELQQSELIWIGLGPKTLTFAFESDLELFADADRPPDPSAALETGRPVSGAENLAVDATADDSPTSRDGSSSLGRSGALAALFPGGRGRFELHELAERSGRGVAEVSSLLWTLAWNGDVTADAFGAVRRGLAEKFAPPKSPPRSRSGAGRGGVRSARRPRRGGAGWRSQQPFLGLWRPIERRSSTLGLLDREDLNKDRVRLLLQRWGILFRELLAREQPMLRWASVFRTLRILELSGEVLAGHFFAGVRGLQFLSRGAYRDLVRGLPQDVVWWLNATDPASLAGVDVEGLRGRLPPRVASTHLVYHGPKLVLVSRRRGGEIELGVEAGHPRFLDYCGVFDHLLGRVVDPLSSIKVETVDGEPAAASELIRRLESRYRVTREGETARLWKTY
ncbi:MAG: DEAD/DEAH box helicase [Acidobacteriota bacterium]